MIAVSGRLQSRTYDDKDGKRQYVTEVVVEDAYFTGSRQDSSNQSQDNFQRQPSFQRPQSQSTAPNFDEFEAMGFSPMDGSEDDLPF